MRFKYFLTEQKEAKEGKTTTDHDHYHKYKVDDNGVGETTSTNGDVEDHVHDIDNWKVLKTNGHKHELNTHHNEKED